MPLVGVEILWEEDGFQFGFRIWQGWAHTTSIAFRHLSSSNSARTGYATEGALFISAQLSSGDAVSALRKVWVLIKLQALVYDILPSTAAVFSYAIGPRKLS